MATVIESLLVSLGFRSDTSGASAFTGAMDGVIGKAAALAGVLGSFFVGNTFVETASKFEQFEVQLTTIMGSSEKAKESLSWISEFAAKTPYEMQQVTDAFVKLQSYGLDARNGGLLESIGNMASGMGKDLDQAVEAIADAVNGENERLKEFGIKGSKAGGGYEYTYNINGQQFKKQASESAADIQKALQEIMDERFKGGMLAMSKTWAGTLSNLSDTWQMFQLRVMRAGIFDALKDRLNGLMMWIFDNKDRIDAWADSIGSAVTYIFERIDSLITMAQDWAQSLGITEELVTALRVAVGYLGTALLGLAVGGAIRGAIAAIGLLFSPVLLIGAAIGALVLIIDDFMAYGEGRPSIIGQLIKDYPVIGQIIAAVQSLGATFSQIFADNAGVVGELGAAFGALFAALQPVFAAILSMLPTLINLIGFVISLIASGLGGAIGSVLTVFVTVITSIVNLFVGLGEGIGTVVGAGVVAFNSLLDVIRSVGVWWDNLVAKFSIGLPEINLPSMPSLPSLSSIGAKLGFGGDTTITTNVTVPTAAAAASVAQAANSSAAQTTRSAKAGVQQ